MEKVLDILNRFWEDVCDCTEMYIEFILMSGLTSAYLLLIYHCFTADKTHYTAALVTTFLYVPIVILYVIYHTAKRIYLNNSDELLSNLEIRERYAKFIFIRLCARIDNIQTKYYDFTNLDEVTKLQNIINAHKEMLEEVMDFRANAQKLFTPNQNEISYPIEEVFGIDQNELEQYKHFYTMNINMNVAGIKELLHI